MSARLGERLHELEDGALIGGGQLLDELEALAEPGGLGRGLPALAFRPRSSSAEIVRARARSTSRAPRGWPPSPS